MADQTGYLVITHYLAIPSSELEFQFSRSGGPGGQNVNRRETRVELLFDLRNSPSLSEEQRERLLRRLATHIDSKGMLRIVATTYRSQSRNREEAVERFVGLLQQGLYVPKRRLSTRPSRQSVHQRLASKRRRTQIKDLRKRVQPDDSA